MKRSAKANMLTPSTSSSIIETHPPTLPVAEEESPTVPHPMLWNESLETTPQLLKPALLTSDQQAEFLELLTKGASPFGACEKLECSQLQLALTLAQDAQFAEKLKAIKEIQGQNVVAMLYQAALKGNVTAQQFWLRHQPPADWRLAASPLEGQDLSDADLFDRCREAGLDFPPELTARLATPDLEA